MSLDYLREKIRIRDGHTCQKCGKKWRLGERRLDVHHLDITWENKSHNRGIYNYDNNNPKQLISLCHKCHLGLPHIQKKRISKRPSRFTKDMRKIMAEMWDDGYTLREIGQEFGTSHQRISQILSTN